MVKSSKQLKSDITTENGAQQSAIPGEDQVSRSDGEYRANRPDIIPLEYEQAPAGIIQKLTAAILALRWPIRASVITTSLVTLTYLLLFVPLYPILGTGTAALGLIPVAMIAWSFGLRASLLANLIAIFLNTALINLSGDSGWDVIIRLGGVPGVATMVVLGLLIGWISSFSKEMQRGIFSRKIVEAAENRLLVENAVLADIGRIISSSPDISQVYDQFAEHVRKLFPFDRIAIWTIDSELNLTNTYATGIEVPMWGEGQSISIKGTYAERFTYARSAFVLDENDPEALAAYEDLPILQWASDVGLKSTLFIPLISESEFVGLLVLRSSEPDAYSKENLSIADRLGAQIAGSVSNARLHAELAISIEVQEALAQVGRIVSSTLDVDTVYERFAEQVRTLIRFDRIVISVIDTDTRAFENVYSSGYEVPNQVHGLVDNPSGFQSTLTVNLVSKDEPIGALHFHSFDANAYSERDRKLGERVSTLIAGAIANAHLYARRVEAEIALQLSEESIRQVAQENAVMAEIGRIIGSSLEIDEVYELFAAQVRRLIPFDRYNINLSAESGESVVTAHVVGVDVPGRRQGDIFPLAGTLSQTATEKGLPVLYEVDSRSDISGDIPGAMPGYDIGFRSFLAVPIVSQDRIIGTLHWQSFRRNVYTAEHCDLAQRVAAQIAGAIANAQLYTQRVEAEKALKAGEESSRRIAHEKAVMAEIGRIIGSSLDINEVYARFAEHVRSLIPFDALVISLVDMATQSSTVTYVAGIKVEGREPDDVVPLQGALAGLVAQTRQTQTIQNLSEAELADEYPGLLVTYKAGMRSFLAVPLIHSDEVIGSLLVSSRVPNAYSEEAAALAERVGSQITAAIANARLYAERVETEAALHASEEEARSAAHENAVMAELGRVIGSSLNIDDVYDRFVEIVKTILPNDRLSVTTFDVGAGTLTLPNISGVEVPEWPGGVIMPMDGTPIGMIIETKRGLIIDDHNAKGFYEEFPKVEPGIRAGLRSILAVPLISASEVVGVLSFGSFDPAAYGQRHLALAERVAAQIAGAIANSQLYAEREKTAAALAEREHQYRHLVESAQDVVFTTDANGRFTYSNPSCIGLTGYTSEELVGKDFTDIVNPRWKRRVQRFYALQYQRKRQETLFEFPIVTKSGETRWVEQSVGLETSGDEIVGFQAIVRDATERKRVQLALERYQLDLQQIIDKMPDCVVIIREGKTLYVNPAGEALLGCTGRDESVGISTQDMVHVDDLERFEDQMQSFWESGKSEALGELRLLTRDGRVIPSEISPIQTIQFEGRRSALIVARDITARKEQEEREKKARSQFLSVLWHELRTPLTPLLASAGMLGEILNSEPNSYEDRLHRNIMYGVQTLRERIDDLLDVAGFQAGTLSLKMNPIDTIQVLEMVCESLRPEAENSELQIVVELPKNLPTVVADQQRFRQVISNLVTNAIKFSPPGGEILVRAEATDKELIVEVVDQGKGIPEDEKERLFDPYFSTDQDRQRFPGLGIGLALAKQIVEAHSGRIWVESKVGVGSKFVIEIPLIGKQLAEESSYEGSYS